MTDYGVTDKGFIIKPYSVILEELKLLAQQYFGEDIDLSENSRFLRFLEIIAKREDELWQKLEEVYYSGFIQFANGENLDRVVALLGIRRKEGETDEELRLRAINFAPYAKATVYSIKAALLELEGVTDVNVDEDTTNHTVSIIVAGGNDDEIAQTIENVRPAGIPVTWKRPTLVQIGVAVKITKSPSADATTVQSAVEQAIQDYIGALHIGQAVIYSDVAKAILSLDEVDDIVWLVAGKYVEETIGTGDGSTTTFYLTNTPVAENTEKIYVDGVLKTRGTDYTIDYTTGAVTFTTAPAAGSVIKAEYLYDGIDAFGEQITLAPDEKAVNGVHTVEVV